VQESGAKPSLTVSALPGSCPDECFEYVLSGTGFHPDSTMSLVFAYALPAGHPPYSISSDNTSTFTDPGAESSSSRAVSSTTASLTLDLST
jgi:hypothetical protein